MHYFSDLLDKVPCMIYSSYKENQRGALFLKFIW